MFQPLNNIIMIKPDPPKEKIGSLFIPATAAEKHRQRQGATGIVRSMGPGQLNKDGSRWPMPDIRVGDRVLYVESGRGNTQWQEVEVDGEKLLKLFDDAILAVVENDR